MRKGPALRLCFTKEIQPHGEGGLPGGACIMKKKGRNRAGNFCLSSVMQGPERGEVERQFGASGKDGIGKCCAIRQAGRKVGTNCMQRDGEERRSAKRSSEITLHKSCEWKQLREKRRGTRLTC